MYSVERRTVHFGKLCKRGRGGRFRGISDTRRKSEKSKVTENEPRMDEPTTTTADNLKKNIFTKKDTDRAAKYSLSSCSQSETDQNEPAPRGLQCADVKLCRPVFLKNVSVLGYINAENERKVKLVQACR